MSDESKIELVYIGRRYVSIVGKKEPQLQHCWLPMDDNGFITHKADESSDQWLLYSKISGIVGNVYSFVPGANPGSLKAETRQFVRQYQDRERAAEWAILDRAAAAHKDSLKRDKEADPFACLAPAREAYRKAPYPLKRAILAATLEYITR